MIGVRRSSQYLLIFLIITKSKVFHCQDYDANSIDFGQIQMTKKIPRHHQHRHHQRVQPQYENKDDNIDVKSQDYGFEDIQDISLYSFPDSDPDDYQSYDYKMREFLLMEGDRWPKFEDIERLAGVSEWKKERWKNKLSLGDVGSTEKPPNTRVQKFTYRRVQGGVNGSKRNAIIAVSAIAPRVRPKD